MPNENDATIAVKIKLDISGSKGKIKSSGGSNKNSKLLKKSSNLLKSLFKGGQKSGNLQMSGLMKGASGGGFWAGLAALVGGLLAAGFYMVDPTPRNRVNSWGMDYYDSNYKYQNVEFEGQRYIAEIEVATGNVTDMMSEREAFEKRIVDSYGRVYDQAKLQKDSQFNLQTEFEKEKKIREALIKEIGDAASLAKYNSEQRKIINDLIKQAKEKREEQLRNTASGPSINWNDIPGSASAASRINSNPVLRNQWLISGNQISNVIQESQTPAGVSQFDISTLEDE